VVLLLGAVATTSVAGCGNSGTDRQAMVISTSAAPTIATATASLTPLERGKVRRDILTVSEAGLKAWLEDDLDAMPAYFSEDWVNVLRDQHESYVEEAKTRKRVHADTRMDVTELNAKGDQALVEYLFTDESYFVDAAGNPLTQPSGRETEFQLTLELKDGQWVIVRIVGGLDNLQ
jgi:hypothetical protein